MVRQALVACKVQRPAVELFNKRFADVQAADVGGVDFGGQQAARGDDAGQVATVFSRLAIQQLDIGWRGRFVSLAFVATKVIGCANVNGGQYELFNNRAVLD